MLGSRRLTLAAFEQVKLCTMEEVRFVGFTLETGLCLFQNVDRATVLKLEQSFIYAG